MNDGKSKNVIEYLDNLIEKGKASQGAIVPLKTAFTKVMSAVDKESWKDTAVEAIDVDDYIQRFANLTAGTYSTQSISVYKSRVNRALGWYKRFLETPGWAPDISKRTAPVSKKTSVANNHQTPPTPAQDASMVGITKSEEQILYKYPLSTGELIQITLPVKLTKKDATRIAAFVSSISIEERPLLRDGNS